MTLAGFIGSVVLPLLKLMPEDGAQSRGNSPKKARKPSTKKGKKEKQDYLVFIDTNVLLDLYRARGDATLKRVTALLDRKERIITTSQLYDEFRRNRLSALEDGLRGLQAKTEKAAIPGAFRELKATGSYQKAFDTYQKRQKTLIDKLHKMIADSNSDPVALLVKKMFAQPGQFHLDSTNAEVFNPVFERAKTRLALGNPPRKRNDPSLGDAINWEWCVEQCTTHGKDLVVVTRDGDYGADVRGEAILNSFLIDEFKSRVSQKRKVVLTREVSDALELIGVKLTKAEKDAERKEVADINREGREPAGRPYAVGPELMKQLQAQLDDLIKGVPLIGSAEIMGRKDADDDPPPPAPAAKPPS